MTDRIKTQKKWANRLFWSFFLLYIVFSCVLIGLCLKSEPIRPWLAKPFMTGLILGGLFVLIAIYHFYSNYLSPYLEEDMTPERGSTGPNIYVLMAMWVVPPLVLQCCVILGFWITIQESPLKGNIYIQPYRYGQIYKKVENFNSTEMGSGVFSKEELPKILERKEKLLNNMEVYFKDESLKKIDREVILYYIPFLIALAFSFLGVLVYTLKDASYRLHTADLYNRTFVSYLIRFLLAVTLSITIAYYFMNDWPINLAPLLFFFIGFFPQRALQFIEEKAMSILKLKKGKTDEVPLNLIQGMTDYKIYRFREVGVGDAQNLANMDLSGMYKNLAYNYRLLCDFVSQAILLIYAKDYFENFKSFGIRDILAFNSMVDRDNYESVSQLTKIPEQNLIGLLDLIEKDPLKSRIQNISTFIDQANQEELSNFMAESKELSLEHAKGNSHAGVEPSLAIDNNSIA